MSIETFSAAGAALAAQLKLEAAHGTAEKIGAMIADADVEARDARAELAKIDDQYRERHGHKSPRYKVSPGMANPDGIPYPAGIPFIELERTINASERTVWSLQRKLDALTTATAEAEQALLFEAEADAA